MQQNPVVLKASRVTIRILWIVRRVFVAARPSPAAENSVWLWENICCPLNWARCPAASGRGEERERRPCMSGWCRPWGLPQQNRWLTNANTWGQRRRWHILSASSGHCHLEMSRLPTTLVLFIFFIITSRGFVESCGRGLAMSTLITLQIIGPINHIDERGKNRNFWSSVWNEIRQNLIKGLIKAVGHENN